MHARLTSQSFRRPLMMMAVLLLFALLSTGIPYFYLLAGMVGMTWFFRRLARESFGIERFAYRSMTMIFMLVTLMTYISPLLSTLPPNVSRGILYGWFWVGWATLAFLAVQVLRSDRWSRRRDRWVNGISLFSLMVAAAIIGEGDRDKLDGTNYLHSQRVANFGLLAIFWSLFTILTAKLLIFTITTELEMQSFAVLLLSLTVWFGSVLLQSTYQLRERTEQVLI